MKYFFLLLLIEAKTGDKHFTLAQFADENEKHLFFDKKLINNNLKFSLMKQLLLIVFLSFALMLGLRSQQVSNPGFENWENAGTVSDEPVSWSSIKTSDGGDYINGFAPVVWWQSTDAHSGSFSVQLTNVQTIVVATGMITNGRVHAEVDPTASYAFTDPNDNQWHTSFTTRPDSVVIWAKYVPMSTDTAQVKVLLHTGEGTLPPKPENQGNRVGYAQINITGTVDVWTRFAAPFEYETTVNPEYMLIVLSAGAGVQAVPESTVFYDDMLMVYGSSSTGDLLGMEKNLIYYTGQELRLDRIPENFLNQASIEIFNLMGEMVFASSIHQNQVNIGQLNLPPALYMVRINGKENIYTQKMFLD